MPHAGRLIFAGLERSLGKRVAVVHATGFRETDLVVAILIGAVNCLQFVCYLACVCARVQNTVL
jgi:hypothetical protein